MFRRLFAISLVGGLYVVACGKADTATPNAALGGSATGGSATGGSATGGSATGGTSLVAAGGAIAGGAATGGAPVIPSDYAEPSGTLDPTFGNNGAVTLAHDGQFGTVAHAVLLQEGSILVGGGYTRRSALGEFYRDADAAVWKLGVTGQLDANFGVGGRWRTPSDLIYRWVVYSLIADGSQRIYAGGSRSLIDHANEPIGSIWRLSSVGVRDAGYGESGGWATPYAATIEGRAGPWWTELRAMLFEPNGLLGTGPMRGFSSFDAWPIWRFTDAGLLDTTYSRDGLAYYNSPWRGPRVGGIGRDNDGGVYLFGSFNHGGQAGVCKFDTAGTVVSDYGQKGAFGDLRGCASPDHVALSLGGTAFNDGLVDGSGAVVAAGYSYAVSPSTNDRHVSVAKYLPNGTPDTSFGGKGFAVDDTAVSEARAMIQSPGGYVYLCGSRVQDGIEQPALWRFTAIGVLDSTFGSGGRLAFGLASAPSAAGSCNDLVQLPDGRLVAIGHVTTPIADDPDQTTAFVFTIQ